MHNNSYLLTYCSPLFKITPSPPQIPFQTNNKNPELSVVRHKLLNATSQNSVPNARSNWKPNDQFFFLFVFFFASGHKFICVLTNDSIFPTNWSVLDWNWYSKAGEVKNHKSWEPTGLPKALYQRHGERRYFLFSLCFLIAAFCFFFQSTVVIWILFLLKTIPFNSRKQSHQLHRKQKTAICIKWIQSKLFSSFESIDL